MYAMINPVITEIIVIILNLNRLSGEDGGIIVIAIPYNINITPVSIVIAIKFL